PGPLHLGPRGRADARRDPVPGARPGHGRHRARAHLAADVPLRAAPDGAPDRHASPHLRVPERHQEQRRGADDRTGRADGQRALDPGVQLPGLRGVHGRHAHLHGPQPARRDPDALAREAAGGARADRSGHGDAASGALNVLTGFDWDIMRAGIQSIPRGQMWAGYALGLSYWQTMGQIVLPQAFRNMLPVLLTQTIILFQDTSLVYVLSITDFLGAASKIAQRDGRLVEMYLFVAVVYFAISFGLSSFVKRLQLRLAVPSR